MNTAPANPSARTRLRAPHGLVVIVMAVLAATSVLAACGSDSSPSSGATPTTAATSAGPVVSDPWARASASGQTNGAAYMVIEGGVEADRLISVSSPTGVATTIELHETVAAEAGSDTTSGGEEMGGGMDMGGDEGMDDGTEMDGAEGMDMSGMMSMRQVASIEVPAGGEVVLEPGGYHVMLIGLSAPLVVGESFPLALEFEKAGTITVTAEVRAA